MERKSAQMAYRSFPTVEAAADVETSHLISRAQRQQK